MYKGFGSAFTRSSLKYLKEILKRRKERSKETNQGPHNILEKPGSTPADAKVINVVFGGSDNYGTLYFAAKRHAKLSKTEKEERPQKNT